MGTEQMSGRQGSDGRRAASDRDAIRSREALTRSREARQIGWRRPLRVRLDGADLVFEWSAEQLAMARPGTLAWWEWREQRHLVMSSPLARPPGTAPTGVFVYPSPEMLTKFGRLADAQDEQIRAFAERYGSLQEQMPARSEWGSPAGYPLLPDRQPLAFWRAMSASFAGAFSLVGRRRTRAEAEQLAWIVNGHLWQAGVEDFLTYDDRGTARYLHSSGGLYGGLAVELLALAADVGTRLCQGTCGAPLGKGGKKYCADCRDSVGKARRQQKYRDAQKEKHSPGN